MGNTVYFPMSQITEGTDQRKLLKNTCGNRHISFRRHGLPSEHLAMVAIQIRKNAQGTGNSVVVCFVLVFCFFLYFFFSPGPTVALRGKNEHFENVLLVKLYQSQKSAKKA